MSATDRTVDLWSSIRPPFEPKGWLFDLRQDVRAAVKGLTERDGTLYARYTSLIERHYDVENVLFYNFGTAYFSNLCRHRLIFEREVAAPGLSGQDAFAHHSHYETGLNPSLRWQKEETVAEWRIPLSTLERPKFDLISVWNAMTITRSFAMSQSLAGRFGLSLALEAPPASRVDISGILKGVFDGVISALHCYRGKRLAE